jgi:hypothetical protein
VSTRIAAGALCLVAAAAGTEPRAAAGPTLSLVWYDPARVAWGTELVARTEATALLARLGANVSWRQGAAGEVTGSGEVWVILIDSGPQQPAGTLVLGATRTRGGSMRALWVRVPNVVAAVGAPHSRPVRLLPPEELRTVGVALGRVIAHEVVHVLAPSLPHGSGLMAGSLSRGQLTAPTIAVGHEATLAVRAALRGEPTFTPPAAAMMARAPRLMEKDY